jgi:hypothetical protein
METLMSHIFQPLPKTQYGVFLSSTNDPHVRSYRLAAREVFEEEEFHTRWYAREMDEFTASGASSLEECRRLVLECAIYIGILGPFYGSVNDAAGMSYSEYEYTVARDANREIGIFILPDSVLSQSPPEVIYRQGHLLARQVEFRNKLNAAHMTRSVADLEDFKAKLRAYIRARLNSLTFSVPGSTAGAQHADLPPHETDTFDRRPIPYNYTLNDLDADLLQEFLQSPMAQAALDERNLLRARPAQHSRILGLIDDQDRLTMGAFLCFAPYDRIVNKFGSCSLHMVVYSGTDVNSRQEYKREVEDNLLNLHNRGMRFFRTDAGLKRLGEVGSETRDDLEIPTLALREALGNALVHRDYAEPHFREQPTRIEVYEDRVEIISFGALVEGISEQDLNEAPESIISRRRNPIIAKIFMYMQLVEMSGSGVARMRDRTQQVGLPPPKVIVAPDRSTVRVVFSRTLVAVQQLAAQGHDVYLSYARGDRAFADRLTTDLGAAGFKVWQDNYGLQPGRPDWERALREAIRETGAVLLLASPDSLKSDYVTGEIALAQLYNKPIYPLFISGASFTDSAPMGMINLQYIDMRGHAYDDGLETLKSTLDIRAAKNRGMTK